MEASQDLPDRAAMETKVDMAADTVAREVTVDKVWEQEVQVLETRADTVAAISQEVPVMAVRVDMVTRVDMEAVTILVDPVTEARAVTAARVLVALPDIISHGMNTEPDNLTDPDKVTAMDRDSLTRVTAQAGTRVIMETASHKAEVPDHTWIPLMKVDVVVIL